ncbi:TetR/AcrR family transcriptional regulator [Parafrigoribacterium mesophilum]|uniref:TetR/AcrR family transcriptional regulator n=1 Tax=Parafrigoribacterium mesophilum TaxID=433646 RepID=UPI0031FC1F0C
MIVETDPTSRRAPAAFSPAKQRILDTADTLFYSIGIHTVGIDRLIKESQVTKATFYKHYRAKDNLILEYVKHRHETERAEVETIVADATSPAEALRALLDRLLAKIEDPGFRGCAFLNIAAEFPEPQHPVRVLVTAHRDWYSELVSELFRQAEHPLPGDAADDFVLASDGAMSGGYAGDPVATAAALQRMAERILAPQR